MHSQTSPPFMFHNFFHFVQYYATSLSIDTAKFKLMLFLHFTVRSFKQSFYGVITLRDISLMNSQKKHMKDHSCLFSSPKINICITKTCHVWPLLLRFVGLTTFMSYEIINIKHFVILIVV